MPKINTLKQQKHVRLTVAQSTHMWRSNILVAAPRACHVSSSKIACKKSEFHVVPLLSLLILSFHGERERQQASVHVTLVCAINIWLQAPVLQC
jgi:hypothetical protein